MKRILIIDYGLGNLRSVQKGLEYAGARVGISKDPADIKRASGLVLPGVGAFRDGMKYFGIMEKAVGEEVKNSKPLLGICLGMQMLASEGEEGGLTRGLDLIPGRVVRFPHNELKVPHMGWNSLKIKKQHPLLRGIQDGSYMYFVHSYYLTTMKKYVLASCKYGVDFPAVISNEEENVMGTQFHPEKSGEAGLNILKNFVEMC